MNLFLEKPYDTFHISDDRNAMVDFDYLFDNQYSINLIIPEGSMVSYHPENLKESNSLLDYSVEYTLTDKQIKLDFRIALKKLRLKKEDFQLWKTSMNKLKSHYNESIIISKL